MTIEDLKKKIEEKTGVPAILLNGESLDENITQAKALISYKRKEERKKNENTRDQFALWCDPESDPDLQAINAIETEMQKETIINDDQSGSGEKKHQENAKEAFVSWLGGEI